MITVDQAWPAISTIFGSTGIVGAIIGVMGYVTAGRRGRPVDSVPVVAAVASGMAPAYADKHVKASAEQLSNIAYLLCRLVVIKEIEAEDGNQAKGFTDRVENKMMRMLLEMDKHKINPSQ